MRALNHLTTLLKGKHKVWPKSRMNKQFSKNGIKLILFIMGALVELNSCIVKAMNQSGVNNFWAQKLQTGLWSKIEIAFSMDFNDPNSRRHCTDTWLKTEEHLMAKLKVKNSQSRSMISNKSVCDLWMVNVLFLSNWNESLLHTRPAPRKPRDNAKSDHCGKAARSFR